MTVVASTKVSKKAVDRNRIRRVLSNDIATELLHGKVNYDIVVVAKKEILESLAKAHDTLITLLSELNAKKN